MSGKENVVVNKRSYDNGHWDDVDKKDLLEKLDKVEVFKLGDFTLKSGIRSPIYIDFRGLVSSLDPLIATATALSLKILEEKLKADFMVGVPYGALPLSVLVGERIKVPFLIRRKEAKGYGTKKLIEGNFTGGQRAVIIEDVVTTGSSVAETADVLREAGLVCEDAVCVLDREQGGRESLKKKSIRLHRLLTIRDVLDYMVDKELITAVEKNDLLEQLVVPVPKSENVQILCSK